MIEIESHCYHIEDVDPLLTNNEATRAMEVMSESIKGRLKMITTLKENKPTVTSCELFVSGPPNEVHNLVILIKAFFDNQVLDNAQIN